MAELATPDPQILDLLERLREKNEGAGTAQTLEPCKLKISQIPTLATAHYRWVSPMLAARFAFAGTWTHAVIGQTLLNPEEMEQAWEGGSLHQQVDTRIEFWERSPPASCELSAVSLLAVDRDDCGECYAVWTDAAIEPKIHAYFGNSPHEFACLHEFLEWLVS